MALTPCVDCAKEISSTAKECPHCGFDYESIRNKWPKDVEKMICPICKRVIPKGLKICPFCKNHIITDSNTGMGCFVLTILFIIAAIAMHHS